jgi:hypothetical protein
MGSMNQGAVAFRHSEKLSEKDREFIQDIINLRVIKKVD